MAEQNEAGSARLQSLLRGGDRVAILAPEALDEVNALVAAVAEPGQAAEFAENAAGLVAAAEVCGRRFMLSGPAAGSADLALMVALTTVANVAAPGALPPWVTQSVGSLAKKDELAVFSEPATWADIASAQPPLDIAALILFRLAALLLPEDDPAQAVIAVNLSGRLLRAYQRRGELRLLREAAERCRVALRTPRPERTSLLLNLALILQEQSVATGDQELLDEAIENGTAAAAAALDEAGRITAMSNLGLLFRTRAERTSSLADAGKAVDLGRQVVAATPAGDDELPGRLANLSSALQHLYEQTGDLTAVTEAVAAARAALAAGQADAAEFATIQAVLGTALYLHHDRTGDPASLDDATTVYRTALQALTDDDPDRPGLLSELGLALDRSGQRSGDAAVLAEAVQRTREAAALTPPGHPHLAGRLANLCLACRSLAERTGGDEALSDAIRYGRQSVAAAPAGHPDRVLALSALAAALDFAAQVRGRPAELDEAVQVHREAVRMTAEQSPRRAVYLTNLSVALLTRAERTGHLADLQGALEAAEQAVRATPPDHAMLGARLTNLSLIQRARFERTGDMAALSVAVGLAQQVVSLDTGDTAARAGWLSNLALTLRVHLERTDDLESLRRAMEAGREAVRLVAGDHPDRPGFLSNLSTILYAGFERTGDRQLLAEAIESAREAVASLPDGHPDRPGFLSNLGNVLQARHERGGLPADLDEAVEVSRQAVELTPEGQPDRPRHLANLASALRVRYELTGARESLHEAVSAATQAADAVTPGDPQQPYILQGLSNILLAHFERTGQTASLDAAVTAARSAAGSVPSGHPARPLMLNSLANALALKYVRHADLDSLDEAILTARAAVRETPRDHPARPARLANLSILLRSRHEALIDPAALGEAVTAAQAAADTMAPGSPDHAVVLFLLAETLATAQPDLTEPGLLAPAIQAYRDAAAAPGASPAIQVRAAAEGGRLAAASGDLRTGLDLLDQAVSALESVAPLDLNRPDQEHRLAQFAGIVSDAAACAAQLGEPERAVLLLEQGRGILLAQALDARPDISALRNRHPEQADRFEELLASLADDLPQAGGDQAAIAAVPVIGAGRRAERRQADAAALRQLTEQIREDPQFAGFRRRPELAELRDAAGDGPVVLINASDLASHALAVTTAGITAVPLPELTAFEAGQQARAFYTALEAAQADAPLKHRRKAEEAILKVLGWLWDTIAAPVLQHLRLDHPDPGRRHPPRLWWSATGPLGMLPLHAAAPAGQDPRRGTLDLVTSSYTPTIRALAHARGRATSAGNRRVLAVCLPETPGCPDLPGAALEMALMDRLFGDTVDVLTGSQATRAAVLAGLPGHAIAHFACHASADLASPSDSGLLVHDHQERALIVSQFIALDLPGAELAFLSACETARVGPVLSDEAIHLGSAFQIAGYRHVVATLWPVGDRPAASMPEKIYQAIQQADSTSIVPVTLHNEVRRIRDIWPGKPSIWAVYAHSGA